MKNAQFLNLIQLHSQRNSNTRAQDAHCHNLSPPKRQQLTSFLVRKQNENNNEIKARLKQLGAK